MFAIQVLASDAAALPSNAAALPSSAPQLRTRKLSVLRDTAHPLTFTINKNFSSVCSKATALGAIHPTPFLRKQRQA
jgi:hypothetical protein